MSSRSIGLRPVGLGGNGIAHHDRVAVHQAIVANKSRLRCALTIQVALLLLITFRLSVGLCVFFGFRPPRFLQRFNLPRCWTWEYVWWLGGANTAVFGLIGWKRNRILYIRIYSVLSILFGILPSLYALYDLSDALMDYWETRETRLMFGGMPVVVLWNMFVIVVLQLHCYGIYFAHSLLAAWRTRTEERKKTTL